MIRTGLCSVTLRAFAVDDVVAVTAAAGLQSIEWGADVHVPPGDLAAAAATRTATEAAGLRVASYGSYYRAGDDDPADFLAVLESARALRAPRIRIWAGAKPSADAEPDRVVFAAREAADRAAAAGIDIAFEYHAGTLTDDAASARALLDAVERTHTYWQPPEDQPDEEALATLRRVRDRVCAVHVFAWWPGQRRRPLAQREALWRGAFELLAARREPLDALLEFVPDDDPSLVAREAQTLARLVEEASRVTA